MNEVTVVYLAREKSGKAAFDRYLASYRKYSSGMDHELVVVLKGFSSAEIKADWLKQAADLQPRVLEMSDYGFDLRAYGICAQQCSTPYLLFFNSFSELLAEDWLAKFYAALRNPGVGLAGATGSWESMYTNACADSLVSSRAVPQRLWHPFRLLLCKACFLPFPNPHLRTNAFLISREVMDRIWPGLILFKRSAYLFENGRRNMLQRVTQAGLRTVVVDKHGKSHLPEAWPESLTFRQQQQQNLLVADNQTRLYAAASPQVRRELSLKAWGSRALPG